MKGKIVSFNPKTEMGKIKTSPGITFDFDLYSWTVQNPIIKINTDVLFDLSGKRAINIKPYENIDICENKSNKNDNELELLIDDKEITNKLSSNPSFVATDVKSAIDNYFSNIIKEHDNNKFYLKYRRTLDYEKMERFLNSAYNNLLEIDYKFEDEQLIKLKNSIENLHHMHINFKKVTAYVKSAYNIIFLSRHPEQKKLQKKLDTNRDKIVFMNSEIEKLEDMVKKYSKLISKIDKKSEEQESYSKKIKQCKRELVDIIHERSYIIEENKKLSKQLKEFYNKHFPLFKSYLKEFKSSYESNLKKIVDVLAFQFDNEIWKKAKQSELITDYFRKANLNDDFSALTYFKYYLKSIDKSKANKEHLALYELQEYLEEQKKRTILCLDSDPTFLTLVKNSMVKIDKKIDVILSTRKEMAINSIKKYQPHILIINPNIKEIDIEKFLNPIKNFIPDIEISFFADKIDKNLLITAKKLGVSSILHKTSQEDEFIKQIEKYIKNL